MCRLGLLGGREWKDVLGTQGHLPVPWHSHFINEKLISLSPAEIDKAAKRTENCHPVTIEMEKR